MKKHTKYSSFISPNQGGGRPANNYISWYPSSYQKIFELAKNVEQINPNLSKLQKKIWYSFISYRILHHFLPNNQNLTETGNNFPPIIWEVLSKAVYPLSRCLYKKFIDLDLEGCLEGLLSTISQNQPHRVH